MGYAVKWTLALLVLVSKLVLDKKKKRKLVENKI